jgi:hypothetical protein
MVWSHWEWPYSRLEQSSPKPVMVPNIPLVCKMSSLQNEKAIGTLIGDSMNTSEFGNILP